MRGIAVVLVVDPTLLPGWRRTENYMQLHNSVTDMSNKLVSPPRTVLPAWDCTVC